VAVLVDSLSYALFLFQLVSFISAVKFSTQQEYLIVSLVLATIESDPTGREEQEEEPQPIPLPEQRQQQPVNNNKNKKNNRMKLVQEGEEQQEESQVTNRRKITGKGERKSKLFPKRINEDEEETEAELEVEEPEEGEEDSRTVKQEPVETNLMEGLVSKRSLDAMTERRVPNPNPADKLTSPSSSSPQKKPVVNPRKRWLEDSSQDE
jgi:DNA polymerase III gamma/tau subunit